MSITWKMSSESIQIDTATQYICDKNKVTLYWNETGLSQTQTPDIMVPFSAAYVYRLLSNRRSVTP